MLLAGFSSGAGDGVAVSPVEPVWLLDGALSTIGDVVSSALAAADQLARLMTLQIRHAASRRHEDVTLVPLPEVSYLAS